VADTDLIQHSWRSFYRALYPVGVKVLAPLEEASDETNIVICV